MAERVKFAIAVRRSGDWKMGQISEPGARLIAKSWTIAFGKKYMDFRKSLRDISEENFRDMRPPPDEIIDYPGCRSHCGEEGNIIIPTDDDDWFRSDAFSLVDAHPAKVIRWRYLELRKGVVKNLKGTDEWGSYFRFQTNNCSFRSPLDHRLLDSHYPDFSGNWPIEHFLDQNMSIHNKTPASLSYANPIRITPEMLVAEMEECTVGPPNLPELVPFQKYIDMLLSLFKKTRPRKTLI